MEAVLRNLDVRVGRIEQILPTLATKTDLERFATKTDVERFATKADLETSERHRLSDLVERLDRGR